MASNAPDAKDWRWAHDLREEGLEFAPFNVMAVFASLRPAEDAVEQLRRSGLTGRHVSLRARTITDDPPAARVEPPVVVPTRPRDAEVAGAVARKLVLLAAAGALAGALIGLVVALVAGFSSPVLVATIAVAAVAGAVVGAVWGGEIGSMGEARKEEGVVVGAHVDDRDDALTAETMLRGLRPMSLDVYDGQGRPIRQL
jgi:hypothetical protein